MKLYFVVHNDPCYDLFVRAGTPEEAVTHWRGYFEIEDPKSVWEVGGNPATAGPLPWFDANGCFKVWPPPVADIRNIRS